MRVQLAGRGRWNGGYHDELTSMAVDACGNVLVGGYTRGALLPGATNAGGEDMFLMKARL